MENRNINEYTSPIPIPDQSVFETRPFSDKKKVVSSSKYKCPSPPSKSPPVSRLGFKKAIFSYDIPQPSFQTPNNKVHSKFETEFYNHQKIGEGSSSIVYKVQSVQDHKFYAVKKRKKSYNGNSLLYLMKTGRVGEIGAYDNLPPHPHCLRYHGAWIENGYLYVQSELCECSLREYMEKVSIIPEEIIWNFILDLTLGLKHIHQHKMIHYDIKPDNILLFNKHGSLTLKIGDFGLAQRITNGITDRIEGDSRYIAPEIFEENSEISFAVDIFSLGATIFEMATNVVMETSGVLWKFLRDGSVSLKRSDLIPDAPIRSEALEHLISLMLIKNPKERITLDAILEYPNIKSILIKRGQQKDGSFNNNSGYSRKLSINDSMELEDISNSFEEDSDLLEFDDGVSSDCQEFNERRESLESTLGSRITQEEEELIYPILSISPKNLMTSFNQVRQPF